MNTSYDVVVIGAGLGGLSTATALARKGYRVCLLEQHGVPGGYATSFVRGRFEFEVALHELCDIGTTDRPGLLRKLFDHLGVTQHVDFVRAPHLYRSVFADLDITLPDGQAYTETLCRTFPSEADGIRRFMRRVFDTAHELDRLGSVARARFPDILAKAAAVPLWMRSLPRSWFATVDQVLDRDVRDPLARAVLCQYWGYFGLPPSQLSFLFFAAGLATYVKGGAWYVKGRSQALSQAFVKAFEGHGGELRLNCAAARITIDGGRVTGVSTEQGAQITAPVVVSNADPVTTCVDLVGLEATPPRFLRRLQATEVAPATVNVYLGLARSLDELGIRDHEVFLNEDADFDAQHAAMRRLGTPATIAITAYNTVLPEISPPGTSMVVLTALAYGEPWCELDPARYFPEKLRIGDAMLDLSERVMPGLRQAAEVVEVSTPVTNMRYARTLGGSIYGFSMSPHNNPGMRPGPPGPIPGLYFAGAWTKPGGGFSPVILSGQMAAGAVARKLGPASRRVA